MSGPGDGNRCTAERLGALHDFRSLLFGQRFHSHGGLPVGEVAVLDEQRDGAAERAAVPYPAQYARAVLLYGHPAAAAVSLLPPLKVAVDVLGGERKSRRHAVYRGHQRRTVRLTRRYESEWLHLSSQLSVVSYQYWFQFGALDQN